MAVEKEKEQVDFNGHDCTIIITMVITYCGLQELRGYLPFSSPKVQKYS